MNLQKLIALDFLSGKEVLARCVKEKNKCFSIYKDHCCAIFKSEGVKLQQVVEEVENSFRHQKEVVDNDKLEKTKRMSP